MTEMKIIVGGSADEDGGAFIEAWTQAEKGGPVDEDVLAFQSWETLTAVMSPERLNLLRHLNHHPEKSIMALAKALGRQYRRVHDDVSILAQAGLLARDSGGVHATVNRVQTIIELD